MIAKPAYHLNFIQCDFSTHFPSISICTSIHTRNFAKVKDDGIAQGITAKDRTQADRN
jgi:hypothetical protein